MLELMAAPGIDLPAGERPLSLWSCCSQPPNGVTHPRQLSETPTEWLAAEGPCTVASVLNAHGQWSLDEPASIDTEDWWFRSTFPASTQEIERGAALCFDGLATLAEVWLNGELLLTADNMFRAYRVDASRWLQPDNELVICFRSLSERLKQKRPRPRWKTNLVEHQQLRWYRTTLQGRIPGWSAFAPAVGPWRQVRLETNPLSRQDVHLHTSLEDSTGIIQVRAQAQGRATILRAVLRVEGREFPLDIETDLQGTWISGTSRIDDVILWWPHTHGEPHTYGCQIEIETASGNYDVVCPSVGFRKVEVSAGDGFGIRINDTAVYCRGACWTVSDVLSLTNSNGSLAHDLRLARDAGANMLRVGGTMVYESDAFYQLCDELGILIWQDFMFANMDYPVEDEAFRDNITDEATQQLKRLAAHPSVVVYCGNSEIEQQAAMLGMSRDLWRNDWFGTELPRLCARFHPGTAYLPSTPSGGVLPFHTHTGVTHYYGVGAYLRPTSDLRQANVKFTPECLGFANLPEPQTVDLITGGANAVVHTPRWKSRVPRDTGAGWDFEDVRDHYLRDVYGVDPVTLRSWDMPRYLELSRTVPGEMMAQAFAEWRSAHSENEGGLTWFFKDLWPAAGWGVVDSTGTPKASYYYLKRSWQTRQLTVTDEGLNGLHLHLTNESRTACNGIIEVTLLKEPNVVVARQEAAVSVSAGSRQRLSADEILGGFYDITYAYRFGPPHNDVVVVTWYDTQRTVISEAFHFIRRHNPSSVPATVQATTARVNDTDYRISLQSDCFLHAVRLSAKGFLPSDNYFHLSPGREKSVIFQPLGAVQATLKVDVEAVNLSTPIRVCHK